MMHYYKPENYDKFKYHAHKFCYKNFLTKINKNKYVKKITEMNLTIIPDSMFHHF